MINQPQVAKLKHKIGQHIGVYRVITINASKIEGKVDFDSGMIIE